jgi:hypothetical protein
MIASMQKFTFNAPIGAYESSLGPWVLAADAEAEIKRLEAENAKLKEEIKSISPMSDATNRENRRTVHRYRSRADHSVKVDVMFDGGHVHLGEIEAAWLDRQWFDLLFEPDEEERNPNGLIQDFLEARHPGEILPQGQVFAIADFIGWLRDCGHLK